MLAQPRPLLRTDIVKKRGSTEKLVRQLLDPFPPLTKDAVKKATEYLLQNEPDIIQKLESTTEANRQRLLKSARRKLGRLLQPTNSEWLKRCARDALNELHENTERIHPDSVAEIVPKRNWRKIALVLARLIVPVASYPENYDNKTQEYWTNLVGALGEAPSEVKRDIRGRKEDMPTDSMENLIESFAWGYPFIAGLGLTYPFPERSATRVMNVKKQLWLWGGRVGENPTQPKAPQANESAEQSKPKYWDLIASAVLNKNGDIRHWNVESPALPENFALTRTEGDFLAILAAVAKKKERPYTPLRRFSKPDKLYAYHRCANPQRSHRALCQKLGQISTDIIEHAGSQGYRLSPAIKSRVSTAS